MAKIDADKVKEPSDTPTIAGLRKRFRSSIGSFWSHSPTMKTAMSTADPMSIETM